ncbi:pectate lyase [Hymenobacter arizonensis]|uniref:Pectate lyase, PelA/Pel-15E family n=1 Tax=Hymenobacter arizonensis TaxID=1227077 RepID=A0A1I5YA75_HYMAR|nr:pectate lyase [Hymenobacter arizonensis]SFQ41114.1 pectate lyase, PelA/Pel-15E family [Hymenobacter arizonensis]
MITLQLLFLLAGMSKVGLETPLTQQVTVAAGGSESFRTAQKPQQAAAVDTTAEKMLVFQRAIGGWPKAVGTAKVDYTRPLGTVERASTLDDKNRNDATIDNNATTREITYLAAAYQKTNNPAYRQAAENGVRYLLKMQYANGGFPQFFPDFSNYRHQITYNDNAMVRVLQTLRSVATRSKQFAVLDASLAPRAQAAVDLGVECILKTQYVRNGRPTAWCAQHDENTLQPAKARAFELASLSGDESVDIVRFLMGIEKPSDAVKKSIESAISWFEKVKLTGYATKDVTAPGSKKVLDRLIVSEPGSTIWARFYELETDRPIYVGRDSKVRYQLSEIENERRAGYLYAGTWPAKLLAVEYPAWQKRVNSTNGEAKK